MPLYEYQCTQCAERVELIQKMTDPAPEQCATCGGAMKKLFSSPAIQFKGSGFYKTDYASPSAAASASGNSESSTKGDSASKSESPAKGDSSSSKSESSSKSDSSSSTSSSDSSSSSSSASSPAKAAAKSE